MTNRIADAIAAQEKSIQERLADGRLTQAKLDDAHKSLNMELAEYVKFQELKSLASTDGTLTLDEANLIYRYLGNTVDHFNKQSAAVKYILTKAFEELLRKRVAA